MAIKCACKTVKDISMEGNDLVINFHDGSQRLYENGIDHYKKMRNRNIFGGVGPYYRGTMRDGKLPYKETKERTSEKDVGK